MQLVPWVLKQAAGGSTEGKGAGGERQEKVLERYELGAGQGAGRMGPGNQSCLLIGILSRVTCSSRVAGTGALALFPAPRNLHKAPK